MATHDLMYDSDAHVFMSRITPESPDLTEDSDLPSSPVTQPTQEAPNFSPVLPDVPYVLVYPPSLNPPPKFSRKRPLKAISDDFPPELAPYPVNINPILQTTYMSGQLMRMIAGIRSQAMPGIAAVNDVLNFLEKIQLLLYPSPPKRIKRNTMMKRTKRARIP